MRVDGPLATWLNRLTWSTGRLNAVNKTFGWAVSSGLVSGLERLCVFGHGAGALGSEKAIYSGDAAYPWPTADQTLKVKSTSASDDGDPAGVGAQTIRVWWLDSANNEATVDVTLDGAALVVTAVSTMRRVNRMQILTSGASGPNVGTVTAYNTAAAGLTDSLCSIRPLEGVSGACVQTVPAGKRDWITDIYATWSDVTASSMRLYSRTSPTAPWVRRASFYRGNPGRHFDYPLQMDAGTDYVGISYSDDSQAVGMTLEGFRETL